MKKIRAALFRLAGILGLTRSDREIDEELRSHLTMLADDYRRAGLDARTLAMLDYAVKITRHPAECSLADVEALRQYGFCDADIWDIAEIAAMYNYTNRLASATGMLPNAEYHGLAR